MTWIFWLYAAGAVLWTACWLAYWILAPWWRSAVGRSLFGSWVALSFVLILAALFRIVELPHRLAVDLAAGVLSAVAVAGAVQLGTVLYEQLRRRDGRPHRRASDRR